MNAQPDPSAGPNPAAATWVPPEPLDAGPRPAWVPPGAADLPAYERAYGPMGGPPQAPPPGWTGPPPAPPYGAPPQRKGMPRWAKIVLVLGVASYALGIVFQLVEMLYLR
jgi:hypothetical protein